MMVLRPEGFIPEPDGARSSCTSDGVDDALYEVQSP